MRARLGVDIGGTFTDLVVIDDATGTARVGKVLTTAKDPAHGVEEGIHALLDEAGVRSDAVRAVVHGTTLATNALIERKGAKTALLTTEGFRDALEIRREGRYDMYDLFIDPPPPLVPRHLRREVPERLLADGSILKTLDEAAARRALAELAREGVEALAICLLQAYVNPPHERRLSEIAREVSPGLSASCSSEAVPEIGEYERASTTCANVYVAPLMARYLEDLERRLAALGIDGQLYIMQSSGGTALPPLARRLPVRLVESGPAAGALAAAQAARERHEPKLLSFDMGGTTAKACVIDDGVPRSEEHTSELQSPCNLVCRLLLEKKKIESKITGKLAANLCVATAAPLADSFCALQLMIRALEVAIVHERLYVHTPTEHRWGNTY